MMKKACILLVSLLLVWSMAGCALITQPSAPQASDAEPDYGDSVEQQEPQPTPEPAEPETEQTLPADVVEDDQQPYNDVITNESLVIELFESAVAKLILLRTEDPRDVVRLALSDVEIFYEEIHLNGNIANRTTAPFQDIANYYAQTFTGDALQQILTTTLFVDIESTLYVSMIGGMSGWGISNLSVERISSSGDNHIFEARFIAHEQNTISQFSIANTEVGYRISSIDYILPYLPR